MQVPRGRGVVGPRSEVVHRGVVKESRTTKYGRKYGLDLRFETRCGWTGFVGQGWRWTDEPVTCARCLRFEGG